MRQSCVPKAYDAMRFRGKMGKNAKMCYIFGIALVAPTREAVGVPTEASGFNGVRLLS